METSIVSSNQFDLDKLNDGLNHELGNKPENNYEDELEDTPIQDSLDQPKPKVSFFSGIFKNVLKMKAEKESLHRPDEEHKIEFQNDAESGDQRKKKDVILTKNLK